ncbi:MAG: sigma-70 family RNA polymerase sigma factor [Bryobacteraceae bacterium]
MEHLRTGQGEVTQLLKSAQSGDRAALDRLTPLLYDELRRLAESIFRRERQEHTMQPTAVVHEAYLRLISQKDISFATRAHFYGIAARLMRQVLVDHSRARVAAKRGGGGVRVTIDDHEPAAPQADLDVMALHEALGRLAELDERKAHIVELRYFGGLKGDEIAELLGIGTATVTRDLRMAEAWLARALSSQPA